MRPAGDRLLLLHDEDVEQICKARTDVGYSLEEKIIAPGLWKFYFLFYFCFNIFISRVLGLETKHTLYDWDQGNRVDFNACKAQYFMLMCIYMFDRRLSFICNYGWHKYYGIVAPVLRWSKWTKWTCLKSAFFEMVSKKILHFI